VFGALTHIAAQRPRTAVPGVSVDSDDIGGVVQSPKGPEEGVWVIAETAALPTKLRKIVVTDERGRFVLPDLPNATYKLWVRGYGLADSMPVDAKPGETVALSVRTAENPREAAKVFPGNYWLSLIEVPSKKSFPMKIPTPPDPPLQGAFGGAPDPELKTQGEWIYNFKRGCEACHQLGGQSTREIPASIGKFDSSSLAWDRLLRSGQIGSAMISQLDRLGHYEGLATLASWSDRIKAGEVPPMPPRPQGVERNLVITLMDWNTDRAFVHDIVATNKNDPTKNGFGPIYGPDWSAGAVAVLDPVKAMKSMFPSPMTIPADRAKLNTWSPQSVTAPSPYWGQEIVWNDPVNSSVPQMDSKGRVWYSSQTRAGNPDFCKSAVLNSQMSDDCESNAGARHRARFSTTIHCQ
jgi:hypothetical protein